MVLIDDVILALKGQSVLECAPLSDTANTSVCDYETPSIVNVFGS